MDQDSFRKLLQTPHASNSGKTPTRTLLPSRKATKESTDAASSSQAAFKPRKVKKSSTNKGPYRDRATERRTGVAGDFAEVEAVLESFEKETAHDEDREAVEEKRRYLGGDSVHSVLVKGLDFALLEQTRVRVDSENVEDDDELEEVFHKAQDSKKAANSSSDATRENGSRKRTREDLIRELKEKRGGSSTAVATSNAKIEEGKSLEEARKAGKFKPIGFKPIGESGKGSKGKGKSEGTEVRKKKKRKVASGVEGIKKNESGLADQKNVGEDLKDPKTGGVVTNSSSRHRLQRDPSPQPDEDFNIFADAGDYDGLNLDDNDESEEENEAVAPAQPDVQPDAPELSAKPRWFADESDADGRPSEETKDNASALIAPPEASRRDGKTFAADSDQGENPPQTLMRLAPLASSAVPSIKDILAADSALEAEAKRKARKEKRKAGGDEDEERVEGKKKKANAEAKLNRDYQKLKTYTAKKDLKKEGASGAT